MATLIDRLRDGLIWTYAALSLAEEQQKKSQQWWELESLRLKEEGRSRLDTLLRAMEERRVQREEWMRTRFRQGLGETGIASKEQVESLRARIDVLSAQIAELRGEKMGPSAAMPPDVEGPDAPPHVPYNEGFGPEASAPSDLPPIV